MKKIWLFYIILALVFAAGAQEEESLDDLFGDDMDLDSLFEEDMEMEEVEENTEEVLDTSEFTVSEEVVIGGSFSSSFSAGLLWQETEDEAGALGDDGEELNDFERYFDEAYGISLGASLYFDARPNSDVRVYGKFNIELPFEKEMGTNSEGETIKVPNIEVFELFSDFDYKNTLFFRMGKQSAYWSEGYYWRPGDLISVQVADPNDPDAELEGPLALKTQLPVGTTNLYLYTQVPADIQDIKEVGLAPRIEFLLVDYEVSVSGLYRYEDFSGLTGSITGPIGDLDIFIEGAVTQGYKDLGLLVLQQDDEWYPAVTAGGHYSQSDWNMSVTGQYLYRYIPEYNVMTEEITRDWYHYAGLTVGFSELFDSDFSLSMTGMGRIQEKPYARVSGSLSHPFGDYIDISFGGIGYLGEELIFDPNVAIVDLEHRAAATLEISFGSTRF